MTQTFLKYIIVNNNNKIGSADLAQSRDSQHEPDHYISS